eukprot:4233945-Karenia_brevis.AAC.1
MAMQTINGAEKNFCPPPLPAPVQQQTPDDMNAYSDGSFSQPDHPEYGLVTAAVWWPGRIETASHLEYTHTEYRQTENGFEVMGYHDGSIGSSA